MKRKKLILLIGPGDYAIMVYNFLKEENFDIERVIIEAPVSRTLFLRRRVRTLGIIHVLGQILHRLLIVPFLARASRTRLEEIKKIGNLSTKNIPANMVVHVPSVNSKECLNVLKELQSKVILLVDTRILSKKFLRSVDAKFLNIHGGITPKYRGWHGAYWALVHKDPENCGITFHLVDQGIDTGPILYQEIITVTSKDNYYTYPILLLQQGLPKLKKALEDVLSNTINAVSVPPVKGEHFYHPTLWIYLYNWWFKGVK